MQTLKAGFNRHSSVHPCSAPRLVVGDPSCDTSPQTFMHLSPVSGSALHPPIFITRYNLDRYPLGPPPSCLACRIMAAPLIDTHLSNFSIRRPAGHLFVPHFPLVRWLMGLWAVAEQQLKTSNYTWCLGASAIDTGTVTVPVKERHCLRLEE